MASRPSSEQRLRPKKSLGQHFLRDENICRNIVSVLHPAASDLLLEIGPGEGALTKYLAPIVQRLVVVDVDTRVVSRMRAMFPGIDVVHQDFLEVDLEEMMRIYGKVLRVVGNIPYHITSPILFHILDHRSAVRDATLMVQKEVAQRLVARPRTKDYGILSVFFQLFADVELVFDVPGNAFYPKPDVMSSIVQLLFLTKPRMEILNEGVFRSMIRSIFGKRRKMLRGSLRYFCDEQGCMMPTAEVDLTRRPEELSIAELVQLSNTLVSAAQRV